MARSNDARGQVMDLANGSLNDVIGSQRKAGLDEGISSLRLPNSRLYG